MLQQQGVELCLWLKDLEDINSKNECLLLLKDSEIVELQCKLVEVCKGVLVGEIVVILEVVVVLVLILVFSGLVVVKVVLVIVFIVVVVLVVFVVSVLVFVLLVLFIMVLVLVVVSQLILVKFVVVKFVVVKLVLVRLVLVLVEELWYMQIWVWGVGVVVVVLLLLVVLCGCCNKVLVKVFNLLFVDCFGVVLLLGDGEVDLDQDELFDQFVEYLDDISLYLELVSLYYYCCDVEYFEVVVEVMYVYIFDLQQFEWQDVVVMGEDLVFGYLLFVGVDILVFEVECVLLGGFNLDDYDVDVMVLVLVLLLMLVGLLKISEYYFDFNLILCQEVVCKVEVEVVVELYGELELVFIVDVDVYDVFDDVLLVLVEIGGDIFVWDQGISGMDYELIEFSDDLIDIKFDLVCVYLDMGDVDGVCVMLEEVLVEGSQLQCDIVCCLFDGIV